MMATTGNEEVQTKAGGDRPRILRRGDRMKAIVQERYGSPDVLALREIEKPVMGEDGVLVRVRAASANPLDLTMRGRPYFVRLFTGVRRPKKPVPGVDVAGIVEAVGEKVTRIQPGDEVFGSCDGAFAEYVCGRERNFAPKPAGITFEQAASIPVAGCTALQAVRDHGRLQPEQWVLINGASGGVGTFTVQLAKAFGGHVTAVCSAGNLDLVRSIGADRVLDYTREDFTRGGQRYDLVIDNVGNRSVSDLRRLLTPKGTLVLVGAGSASSGLARVLKALAMSRFVRQRLVFFIAKIRNEDLVALKELIEAGKVTPIVDRTYPLREAAEALRYLETRHARAKVAITV